MKKCGGPCGRLLSLSSFDIAKGRRDGRRSDCKVCRRKRRGPRGKEGQQARALEKQLAGLLLSGAYTAPSLANILSRAITEVRQIGASGEDFAAQVRAVRKAIEVGGCRRVDEIVEDTELSRWAVDHVLRKLVADKVIETRDAFLLKDDAEEPGRAPVEYHPVGSPRGEDFTHRLYRASEDNLL